MEQPLYFILARPADEFVFKGCSNFKHDPARTQMVESVVTMEAPHAGVHQNQGPEGCIIRGKDFTYNELYEATDGFRVDRLLGQGGFGQVYKGFLDSNNQIFPLVDSLLTGIQELRYFLVLLKVLEYLHSKVPPIINRDVKCANILLGEGYHPKLSDFGLAKQGPTGDNTHVSTRVMGTAGYCAPEYLMSGKLTVSTDIYSFGVVMLEVLTGRIARDENLPESGRNLARWVVNPVLRADIVNLVDPALQGQCSTNRVYHTFLLAARCASELPTVRPTIAEVVSTLNIIISKPTRRRRLKRGGPSTPTGTSSGGNQAQVQDQEEVCTPKGLVFTLSATGIALL
ncbi:hypothetical protein HU200_024974 [Digitaria exilis]|uniref:Protein kinase domain-containing protein n=1 Tax=Digitaria exilis TaxID=1010633 RepID=A0A835C0C3_9POAL|nr:hypothetical protein HU200_024974 [Digitaria exilis]